jgi:inositol-pentakisphosphate 2-kinase
VNERRFRREPSATTRRAPESRFILIVAFSSPVRCALHLHHLFLGLTPHAARGEMPARGYVECSATLGAAAAAGWAYLAEGGAHLVLERRDVADDDPNVAGRVLRLRKAKTGTSSSGEDVARDGARDGTLETCSNALTDASLWASHPGFEDANSVEDRSWAFAHHVMRPLLGGRFVDPGAFAPVDREFLRAVADAVEPARPSARRARSGIDLAATRAALVPDANRVDRAFGAERRRGVGAAEDWFSVEIKPKCGFALPGDPKGTSRFAMHQALRVRRGEVRRASAYDPLDLFAGCDEETGEETNPRTRAASESESERKKKSRRALSALADAPRNNLRVARRGRRWPESDSNEDSDTRGHESLDAFVQETDRNLDVDVRLGGAARLLDLVDDALRQSGVLAFVLRAQRRDAVGAETAARLWRRLSAHELESREEPPATREEPPATRSTKSNEIETSSFHGDAEAVEKTRRTLRDFVIAAVAKDCSVLVAMRGARDDDAFSDDDDGTFALASTAAEGGTSVRYRCRVSVVDVDLKPIANMPKWLATHREIAENWGSC